MDVSSMMKTLEQHDAARRVAGGIGRSRGNGMLTSATTTTGAGKVAASEPRAATAISSTGSTGETTAKTAATGASASSATSSQDITSSDFLTLLVAEMQNQDPTQPTDPNTYIQQLVGVNSLQQLISINSELGQATGGSSSGDTTPTPPVSGGVPSGG